MDETSCGAVNQSLCHDKYIRTTKEAWAAYLTLYRYIIYLFGTSTVATVFNVVWYGSIVVFGVPGAAFTMVVLWKDRDLRKTFFYRLLFVESFFEGLACFGAGVGYGANSGWWTNKGYTTIIVHGKEAVYHTAPNWLFWILEATVWDFGRMGDVAAYLTFVMSLDRFCATLFPLQYHKFMTKRRRKVMFWLAMFLVGFAFLLELNSMYEIPVIGYKNETNGSWEMEYRLFVAGGDLSNSHSLKQFIEVWVTVRDYTNFVKMPMIVVFLPLSSILIAVELGKMEQTDDYKRKRNAFRMLAVTSLLTVLLYIPRIIYTVLSNLYPRSSFVAPEDVGQEYYMWRYVFLIAALTGNWMEITYALNFYIMYALIGSFRKSANKYLLCRKQTGNESTVGIGTRNMGGMSFVSRNTVHPRPPSPSNVANLDHVKNPMPQVESAV